MDEHELATIVDQRHQDLLKHAKRATLSQQVPRKQRAPHKPLLLVNLPGIRWTIWR